MKKESRLLQEIPRINAEEDIDDVDDQTYSMLDHFDVYDSDEYGELSKRTDTAAKQLIEKDRDNRRKSFTYCSCK